MLKLIIEDDEGRKTVVPFARDEITIGRQEGNTIRLTERNVSRRHARLMRQNGHVLIEDLGSSNGIKINGDRIQGQVKINDGDLVQIGDYDLAIQRDEDKPAGVPADQAKTQALPKASPDTGATMPALPALEAPSAADEDVREARHDDDEGEVDDGKALGAEKHQATAVIRVDQIQGSKSKKVVDLSASEAPRLVVMNTDLAGKEFTCGRTEVKIGRVEENDIAIDHRSLSRTHCKLVREDGGDWRVVDMQSANGLMVNGETYAQVTLRSGDVIELGHVKLKFLAAGEKYVAPAASGSTVQVDRGDDDTLQKNRQTSGGVPKGALIAGAAAFFLLILLVGGYFIFRSEPEPVTPKPPKKTVEVTPKPPPTHRPEVENPPDKTPPPEAPEADPEAAKKAAEKIVSEARAAIADADFDRAELLLQGCKVGDVPCPEAKQLLTQIQGEKGYRNSLKTAEDALDAGELEKARLALEAARSTKLLREKYEALEARRAEAVKAKLSAAKPPEVVKAPPPPPPPPTPVKAGPSPEIQKLLDEAKDLMKEKQWQAAINRMEKCSKIDPTYAECYLKRGTAHGNLKEPELVVKYYKLYLQFAKPEDPMVPKVQQRVKEYEESLKK